MILLHIQDKEKDKKKNIFINAAVFAIVYQKHLDNKNVFMCFFLAVIVLP